MTYESVVDALYTLGLLWDEFFDRLEDLAETIAAGIEEAVPQHEPLPRPVRKMTPPTYHYIPSAPRNRPYQRRAF